MRRCEPVLRQCAEQALPLTRTIRDQAEVLAALVAAGEARPGAAAVGLEGMLLGSAAETGDL